MVRADFTPEATLGHADEALYYAKDRGRNQIHCYERLIESGELLKRKLNSKAEFFQ